MPTDALSVSQMRGTEPVRTADVAVRERRDPSAATQPLQFLSPGMYQMAEWDAQQAIRLAFYANVIVYRCVQIVATTISSLPFLAGPRPPKRPGTTAETVDSSRLQQLLGPPPGGPAPKLSARRLWAWTVAQRLVTGKHGWELELAGQDIAAAWPLTSARLRPIPSTGGTEWFSRFEYGQEHDPRRLRPDQIVYGWDPSLHDFRQPESALQAARLDVSIAVMMDRYNVAFLRNDARPAAVVVTEAFATDEDFRAFKGQFRGEYGGPDNAGKTAFVEANGGPDGNVTGAIDIKVLGLSQKDAQFIEQHKASLERIAMALGVPWSKLDASGRTFSNAGEEDHAWWESTLLPRLQDFADEVNMQLAPRLGREVGWFDTSGVRALQAPKNVTAVGAPSLAQGRLATIDEARDMVGLPPLADGAGNRFFTDEELAVLQGPAQLMSAALLPATVPAAPPEEQPALPAANTTTDGTGDGRAPIVENRGLSVEQMELRRTMIWKSADSVVRSLEGQWERRWRAMFARQQKAVLSRLAGNRGRVALREGRAPGDEVFDAAFWQQESAELAQDLYEAVTAAGGARVAALFGMAFDLDVEWAQAFIRTRANQLAGQVTDTTYTAIKEALAAGVAEGEGVDLLADRVRHVFDVATETRATTIARTEVISAYNGAATGAASALPADVVAGREWIATRDSRTREAHAEADGQVVAMDAPFSVDGGALMYPGDPAGGAGNTVNCRCTVAFLTPDEMAERAGRINRRVAQTIAIEVARGGMTVDEARQALGVHDVIDLETERRARRPDPAEPAPPAPTVVEVITNKFDAPPLRAKRIERDAEGNITRIIEEAL